MKRIFILILAIGVAIFTAFGEKPNDDERAAQELRSFERDWVTASINHDNGWLEKFLIGKMFVVPLEPDAAKTRAQDITATVESLIPADLATPKNMKVRITGKVSVLTNSPSENASMEARSYSFLDTFNKQNGKWQLIASNFLPAADSTSEMDEKKLMQTESEWRNAIVQKDVAALKRILADDFVGIENSGKIFNKSRMLEDIETDDVEPINPTNLKLRVYGDSAIVTGRLSTKARAEEGNYVGAQSLFTENWIRRNGQWQIVNYQNTLLSL